MKPTTKAAVDELQEFIDGSADILLGTSWVDIKENGLFDNFTCLVGITSQVLAETFLTNHSIKDEAVNMIIEMAGEVNDWLDDICRLCDAGQEGEA